jgi:hypothetical protein
MRYKWGHWRRQNRSDRNWDSARSESNRRLIHNKGGNRQRNIHCRRSVDQRYRLSEAKEVKPCAGSA